ncbi:MAG TPA: amino acid ABC transporter substrate-binding protein [Casimicrobiaceae bacterium]|jgi:branched-chain amino acid transport system substrate-binding protein|nr:amino acid ABC transporter substrate-binding protein [Casimicrobiaceae bacterium]
MNKLMTWFSTGLLALSLALVAPVHAQQPLKIGFGMSLTGPLAGNGKAALIAMQIWAEDVNTKGGVLGRKVELVYYDDQTNPSTVPSIYSKLLDVDKVDLLVSGYGTNVIAPAMPIVMQRNMAFMGLFGLNVNSKFNYDRYFQIMPAGPEPAIGWTQGFFDIAMALAPKPQSIALVGADAEYPALALEGARAQAKRTGLKVVYDKTYPPNTVDFSPILRAIQATNPDLVFVASYPPDSAGMVRAANEVGLKTRMFGGGMVGPQFAALKTQLGPLLNGIVNYETFAPDVAGKFPFLEQFLAKYQGRAVKEGVDPLGFYLPPYAYAMMQVLEQSIKAVGGLDQAKLADYMHTYEFDTFVGKVRFAKNGEWAVPRMLTVQYHGISGNDLEQWMKPGHVTVLAPASYKTGAVMAPYQDNKK